MKRYNFLSKDSVYDALNRLRAAFLAAKDGNEVEEIILGLLTHDERMKIGRRIQVAELLEAGLSHREISEELKVSSPTIRLVSRKIEKHPGCFSLINKRQEKTETELKRKAYQKVGGPKMIYKKRVYTGFKRKDVKR